MDRDNNILERLYLPAGDKNVDVKDYLYRYIEREFSFSDNGVPKIYSVPKNFHKTGERQASLAEEEIFKRLLGIQENASASGLWVTFFHSASYAGRSNRNHRDGKLMIREHDFVVFVKYKGNFHVALMEVKSTNDINTKKDDLEKTSDSKVIKNNKRSAQHQLRDHLEVLYKVLDVNPQEKPIQSYIMWPFLGAYTKSPNQQIIKRWKEDNDLHAFEETISNQDNFDNWFLNIVANGQGIDEQFFVKLLNRYIILSCGVFVDEINKGMLALLTQEQLQLLNTDICQRETGGPLIVHGAAGTGKTLLVLRKLQQLHETGQLNEQNRALYICYWPGIRFEVELKLQKLGIGSYVDTVRFYISRFDFLDNNKNKYKHVFMDEAEAICLAFDKDIMIKTCNSLYRSYHKGNCQQENCKWTSLDENVDIGDAIRKHSPKNWGELWFMVDINQASLFLPKHSPQMLKTPHLTLVKVMRSTGNIFNFFKQFYDVPMPLLPKAIMENMKIPHIHTGHHINGPPIFWVDAENTPIDQTVAEVVVDLCSTKGIKPNDICVLPFLVNEKLVPDSINRHIEDLFVENGYHPKAVGDVENFLREAELSDFLISWVLRVKGLEFKIVIMVIEDDDFDCSDSEDRKKVYIMASRCTCMLILISNQWVKNMMELEGHTRNYPFHLNLQINNEV